MQKIEGFTPEPWVWTVLTLGGLTCESLVSSKTRGCVLSFPTSLRGELLGDYDYIGLEDIDKKLIAAAPDLYSECLGLTRQRDALREALEVALFEMKRVKEYIPNIGCIPQAIKQAQAALEATKEPVCK